MSEAGSRRSILPDLWIGGAAVDCWATGPAVSMPKVTSAPAVKPDSSMRRNIPRMIADAWPGPRLC